MNALKVKTVIECETCGCNMNRVKTIKVAAATREEAIAEANEKARLWKESLKGQNCKVCTSILASV
jgi:hypothetical protein